MNRNHVNLSSDFKKSLNLLLEDFSNNVLEFAAKNQIEGKVLFSQFTPEIIEELIQLRNLIEESMQNEDYAIIRTKEIISDNMELDNFREKIEQIEDPFKEISKNVYRVFELLDLENIIHHVIQPNERSMNTELIREKETKINELISRNKELEIIIAEYETIKYKEKAEEHEVIKKREQECFFLKEEVRKLEEVK